MTLYRQWHFGLNHHDWRLDAGRKSTFWCWTNGLFVYDRREADQLVALRGELHAARGTIAWLAEQVDSLKLALAHSHQVAMRLLDQRAAEENPLDD